MVDTTLLTDTSAFYSAIAQSLGVPVTAVVTLFIVIGIWSMVWKGLALWKSARKNQNIWFIIMLVVNTIGILEILYIFIFSKINPKTLKIEDSKNSEDKNNHKKKK